MSRVLIKHLSVLELYFLNTSITKKWQQQAANLWRKQALLSMTFSVNTFQVIDGLDPDITHLVGEPPVKLLLLWLKKASLTAED